MKATVKKSEVEVTLVMSGTEAEDLMVALDHGLQWHSGVGDTLRDTYYALENAGMRCPDGQYVPNTEYPTVCGYAERV